MEMGFWATLKKPIMALAPMANVTDVAFRRIIAKYGKPDVMFTEFVSADGLLSKGRERLLVDLMYSESERPIVAQLFSGNPEKIFEAAKLIKKLGFDGLDINMGCPDKSIEKSGAGAALIKEPRRAREIIRAAKEGAEKLPVSIKTRLGYGKDILEEWLPELFAEKPAAIIIHARTRKEMSKAPTRWERVKRAVEIRNSFFAVSPSARPLLPEVGRRVREAGWREQRGSGESSSRRGSEGGDLRGGGSKTLILGNGDVTDLQDARKKAEETGADGVMLGRAIFGNPFLFAPSLPPHPLPLFKGEVPSPRGVGVLEEGCRSCPSVALCGRGVREAGWREQIKDSRMNRLRIAVEHARLFEKLLGEHKSFAIMKKHFKAYAEGFDGAKKLRMELMETENAKQVEEIIHDFLASST